MAEVREERRLAAVLSADVVGYSRIMGADEWGTLTALKSHRNELINPKISEHNGRIVKLMGDGILAEFASAVDAVRCAIEIQRSMPDRNAAVPEDKWILFRIGINVGDIILEDDDIYGDGVNIAARIQELADPGGICLSRTARDQVRDRLEVKLEDLGEVEAKNIIRPVRVFRVSGEDDGIATLTDFRGGGSAVPTRTADKPTIVVLPFTNLSGAPEQEYFSDGITEDIIAGLSRNRSFFVISRSTSFTYKGRAVDIGQVAKELGVRYVLEGSVRKGGARLRISGQLADAAGGHHIWSERYDRELEDIFDLQDEITQSIIGAISPGILSAEIQRARRKDTESLDAWDLTMRGHWHIRRFSKEDNAEARRLIGKAIEIDPGSATAHSDLAFASHMSAVFGWSDSPVDAHIQLGESARSAVLADELNAFAHTTLGIFELFSGRHDDAISRLERAIDLDPNLAFARGYLGTTYAFGGESDAAILNLEGALRLSPHDSFSVIWHICMGWASLAAERFLEGVNFARQAIEDNPEFADNYSVLAACYGHLGMAEEARAALDRLEQRMPNLTLGSERLERPFRREEDKDRFLDGLRRAGLPE